jgi:hypothetical protein
MRSNHPSASCLNFFEAWVYTCGVRDSFEAFQTEPMSSSKYLLGSGAYRFVPSGHLSTKAKVLPPQNGPSSFLTTVESNNLKMFLQHCAHSWIEQCDLNTSSLTVIPTFQSDGTSWLSVLSGILCIRFPFLRPSKGQYISKFEENWPK